jgi:hypothetical protein
MGNGAAVELQQGSSGNPPDHASETTPISRGLAATKKALSKAAHLFSAQRRSSSTPRDEKSQRQRAWDSALDDPEAKAFLERAMKRRARMEEQGLIHRP